MKHPLLLGEQRLINLAALHRFRSLAKYPRVGDRSAADHHSVNSAFIQTLERLFRRGDVAATDHRNRNRALHRGDHIPVGPSAVTLGASAPVNCDHVGAAVFDYACNFNGVDRRVIPAGSNLHRHRN